MGDHREKLIVILVIVLKELLRKGLGLRFRHFKGLKERLLDSGRSDLINPDRDEPSVGGVLAAVTNRHASRVNEKVELSIAQGRNPFKPLNAGRDACSVDGSWREAVRGEGEAAAAGSTKWFFHFPGGRVKGSQVCLEDELQLNNRSRRMGSN